VSFEFVTKRVFGRWFLIICAFRFTGSILASGVARGAATLNGNTSWLVPLWLQLLFSGLIIAFVYFLPESPRWLYVHNKRDQAVAVLTKFHGEGNVDSEWVKLQLSEYEEFLELNGSDKRWWDYRTLFSTPVSRYRIACSCCIAIFGQWAGNGKFLIHCACLILIGRRC
jgi:hypothetical protein